MTTLPDRVEVLILGGGPAGIEAALAARAAGFPTLLFELGSVGASMLRWGHVRLFSPWRMNRSRRGEKVLRDLGVPLAEPELHPSGREFVQMYLQPLADSPMLRSGIATGVKALAAGRQALLKGDRIGDPRRGSTPFRVLWDADGRRGITECRVLIDATGTYATPNPAGSGGLAALGEERAGPWIDRHLVDPLGADRSRYAGCHTVIMGAGYSAATAIRDFVTLLRETPGTRVTWVVRSSRQNVIEPIDKDPLPERKALTEAALAIAANPPTGLTIHRGAVLEEVDRPANGLALRFRREREHFTVTADRCLALVGYRPDRELLSELQVHHCYATDGLMKVSAALLSSGGGDCLAAPPVTGDLLVNPEPALFVIGSKSYGRNSHYLLRSGIEQVESVMATLATGDPADERAPS